MHLKNSFFIFNKKIKEEEKLKKKLQFNNKYFKSPPKLKENAEIRFNLTQVLREEHHLNKKKIEEEKILEDFEKNLRDSTEFNNWKTEKLQEDKIHEFEAQQKSNNNK